MSPQNPLFTGACMARPRKVSAEAVCQRYSEAVRQNQRYPISATAKTFGVSTRTVNRRLLEAVYAGMIAPELVHLPIFKPKVELPKTELAVAWT